MSTLVIFLKIILYRVIFVLIVGIPVVELFSYAFFDDSFTIKNLSIVDWVFYLPIAWVLGEIWCFLGKFLTSFLFFKSKIIPLSRVFNGFLALIFIGSSIIVGKLLGGKTVAIIEAIIWELIGIRVGAYMGLIFGDIGSIIGAIIGAIIGTIIGTIIGANFTIGELISVSLGSNIGAIIGLILGFIIGAIIGIILRAEDKGIAIIGAFIGAFIGGFIGQLIGIFAGVKIWNMIGG